MSHTKIRALQQWCKALVDGYKDVNITNMSSSWRDGLAFCALIHRFRPDLINFDALSKTNVYDNNQLAFTIAESLGVPALLEAKDMNDLPVPDKLSVITYVASMHNYFKDKEKLGGPGVSSYKGGNIQVGTKRHQENDPLNSTEPKRSTPDQSEEKTQRVASSPSRQRSPTDDLCTLCQGKVYLIEKQIDNGKLYHRSCFRSSYMSPTSKILSKSHLNGSADDTKKQLDNHCNLLMTEDTPKPITAESSAAKIRLYEKRKEQIQKTEEKLKAERSKENELYKKRQNTPSGLRNHLRNLDKETKENSRESSGSPAPLSPFISKRPSPDRSPPKTAGIPEQPSWAKTKLNKVFDKDPGPGKTAMALSLGKEAIPSRNKNQSRDSSPDSPVLMMQVTSRTMEDKQFHASKSQTKTSTNLDAEAAKPQVVSGLLKSLANIRHRQNSTGSASPISSPQPPKSPSEPPPFAKLSSNRSTSPVSNAMNSEHLNCHPVTHTQPQSQIKDTKAETSSKKKVGSPQKEQTRSMARVKTVITSTPNNPITTPKSREPSAPNLASSEKIKLPEGGGSLHSDSLTKSNLFKSNPLASAPKYDSKHSNSLFETSSPTKSKVLAAKTLESSPSHSSSKTKSNIPENPMSRFATPTKSRIDKISSDISTSHSASPNESNTSEASSKTSTSFTTSLNKYKSTKLTPEASSSNSSASLSGRSNLTESSTKPSPSKSLISPLSLNRPATVETPSRTSDNRPQSLLERIEQYSKVAAGVEKPSSEQSAKQEILPTNCNTNKPESKQLSKSNTFATTPPESIKEHNTVNNHVASPSMSKRAMYNKPETKLKSPLKQENGHASKQVEITKDLKPPSLPHTLTSQTQSKKNSSTEFSSPKKFSGSKQTENSKTLSQSNNPVSTPDVFSIGLTKLHPAHYIPKSSDSNLKANPNPCNGDPATMQSINTRVNPIPKPRRQKIGLIPCTTTENKENPVETKLNYNNNNNFSANSHKMVGALSERQDTRDPPKTEWQVEAERRIAARRGKYIDPENGVTRFIIPDSSAQADNEKNNDANENGQPVGLKKINVNEKFSFSVEDSLNSNSSLEPTFVKKIIPKQNFDSLEWNPPKKRLSTDEIQKELKDIDSKLTDLELRGRQLEVSIRSAANEEDENFMVEWFQLINEKNELVRRENDLIYKSQEQELEEEQIRIDQELQNLMTKPYEKKTKAERKKEEELIQKKIAVVNQRNLIVESIDEDRLRYQEEDEGIKEVLQSKGYL